MLGGEVAWLRCVVLYAVVHDAGCMVCNQAGAAQSTALSAVHFGDALVMQTKV
jgi:hypothetical protein